MSAPMRGEVFGGCTGKQRFESKPAALRVQKAMTGGHRMKRRPVDDQMQPYRCNRCHSWHLGSAGMR